MKKNWITAVFATLAIVLVVPASLQAQKEEKDKEDKEKKEVQQITITRKNGKDNEKLVIEVNGEKVTINGKSLEEFKDKDGDISININKWKDPSFLFHRIGTTGSWSSDDKNNMTFFGFDEDRAMLGVTTQKTENGAEIESVTKESAAEKAGLKEHDIITRIEDNNIEDPDDLSEEIQNHKPGDKVTIYYLRDKKEMKTTAELGKWKGNAALAFTPGGSFNWDLEDLEKAMPRITAPKPPKEPMGIYLRSGGTPKLGLSVQDDEDGKGAKVVDVDEESNAAKAGIKEDDVIFEADGKPIKGTDDMVQVIRDSREKTSIMLKIRRGGKTENVEVKMPRRIKTADL